MVAGSPDGERLRDGDVTARGYVCLRFHGGKGRIRARPYRSPRGGGRRDGPSVIKSSLLVMALTLVSCATQVRFDVEHPPVIDLRGAGTIAVIPFELHSLRGFEHLSAYVTAALMDGIRGNMPRGSVALVDLGTLAQVPRQGLWRYADVLITGRITNVRPVDSRNESTQIVAGEEIRITAVTLTVSVDIEYSYIRARDGRILGTFRKTETFGETAYFVRRRSPGPGNLPGNWGPGNWRHPDWGRPGPWNSPGWGNPELGRGRDRGRRGGRHGGASPRRDSWEESLAKHAISRFATTMDREIAPWTTTEGRSLRRRSGNEPELDEARRLVRMGRYDRALGLYLEIYERYGNIFAGYNAAILFAANDRFAEALELLETLHRGLAAEGRSTPRFIRTEIERMAGFVNGFRLLDEFRAGGGTTLSGPATAGP